jgi:hypothetical protein
LKKEKKKIEELTEEEDMDQEHWDYDQDEEEEYDEDAWARLHHAEEYTEQAPDSSSKDSSFVAVLTGKESLSKEEKGVDPDLMETLKLVMENGRKTVEMVLNAQKEKTTDEEEKLDQEDQTIKQLRLLNWKSWKNRLKKETNKK